MPTEVYECVINVSEGRDRRTLTRLAAAAGPALLDLHRDPHHHRSVLTLAGSAEDVAARARDVATSAIEAIDLRRHAGVHPRLGALDVVPFVPFAPGGPAPRHLSGAVALRDAFARWLGSVLGIPAFLYGPLPGGGLRTLPEVRRHAFGDAASGGLEPDEGPSVPDPRSGATAVGARRTLVAYNVWVSSLAVARAVAPAVRGPAVRALALAVGDRAQVSCNLVDPDNVGPAALLDSVTALVGRSGGRVEGTELVGLVPQHVLHLQPEDRWAELGLSEACTVEARLAAAPARPGAGEGGGRSSLPDGP
jgi:glutamate formiminotransferase